MYKIQESTCFLSGLQKVDLWTDDTIWRNFYIFFSKQESKELFICLYKTWSHSQAPTIALVFLAGCYNHALDLVRLISEQEITLDFLLELDRLVQILESGIFSCKFFGNYGKYT